jgi:hypothetical protein
MKVKLESTYSTSNLILYFATSDRIVLRIL